MNRRDFNAMMFGGLAATTLPKHWLSGLAQQSDLRVNDARINTRLTALAEFGKNPQGGVSRVAYSDFDKAARAVVMDWMREAKLDPVIDFAGNIIGRRRGMDASLKPILFGSHIDSVPEGGNYDGNVGSIGAIEVAQTMAERTIATRHPLEIVVWQNEEGGLYGSRAVSGQLTAAELKNVSNSGKTIEQGITFIGGDVSRIAEVKRNKGDIAGYLELHIEQGGTLEKEKIDIGVVQGIVGIKQWQVTVTGVQNHAGTTAMADRHDALLAASKFVQAVNRVVTSTPGRQVGTVGRIQALPGAPNVISGNVLCTLELRDLDDAKVIRLYNTIQTAVREIERANGVKFEFASLHENIAAPSDPRMRGVVAEAAKSLGLTSRLMPSGAGHDAQAMAQIGPMGMIFIPSVGGISHSPKEYSTPKDIANGANVLFRAVMAADKLLG